jgi:putative transposase
MLCRWLGVSPSGYYAWCEREASKRAKEDRRLLEKITEVYQASEGRYGSPRVFNALKKQGFLIGRKRVERLMREAGLVARCVKVVRRMPGLKRFQKDGSNLLLDLSKPSGPDQVWVGDVTYLKLKGQWQYLATVMDLHSRRILGWSLSSNRRTDLTLAALRNAMRKRNQPKDVVFHSDRGIEYLSYEFRDALKRANFRQSFNRPGCCTDNAYMESFFHSLKCELIRGTIFKSVEMLRTELSKYINKFYNSKRAHTSLGYISPIEYERRAA